MFLYNDTWGEKIAKMHGAYNGDPKAFNDRILRKEQMQKQYVKNLKLYAHNKANSFNNIANYAGGVAIVNAMVPTPANEAIAFVSEATALGATGLKHIFLVLAGEDTLQGVVTDAVMSGTKFCPNPIMENSLDLAIPNGLDYLENNYR